MCLQSKRDFLLLGNNPDIDRQRLQVHQTQGEEKVQTTNSFVQLVTKVIVV